MAGFVLPFLRKKYFMQLYRRVSGYGLGQRFLSFISLPIRLQNVNPKEGAEKLKRNRKRFLAGALAFLLTCSTAARAADLETKTENLPELAEIRGQLNEDEIILAEDLILTVGDQFDGENKDPGLKYDETKVKVTYEKVINGNSYNLTTDIPGNYQALYRVEPLSGNPSYQVTRKVIVKEKEPEFPSQENPENGGNEEKDFTEDAEPDPELQLETLDAIPDMPGDVAGTTNIYEDGEGVFLSVVPAAKQKARAASTANLEVGVSIPYPTNLGNYSTNYFTVNGRTAYCLESAKATPPASDYVANEFESNGLLQKVLYYGYGGPGDVTDIYMPTFDEQLKYLFTHLAAAYAYCRRVYGLYHGRY